MKVFLMCGVAAVALSACAASVPDSGSGVGFGNYDDYEQRTASRDAQLEGRASVPAPASVDSSVLGSDDPVIARAEAALNGGQGTVQASPSNPAPQVVENAAGISDENNFEAVSGERDIAADAALIAQNRAQFEVIQPTALPSRAGAEGPNIVAYALQTSNPKGTSIFRRSSFSSEAKAQRACAGFASADLAQEAFLAAGGPERDRQGMDPDGDGYACAWDPAPFRNIARN